MPPLFDEVPNRALRLARAERRWPQRFLAHRSGISKVTISLIERGKIVPTQATMIQLAEAFGLTLEELLAWGRFDPRTVGEA